MKNISIRIKILFYLFIILLADISYAINIIRDAEIETDFYELTKPLLEAAELGLNRIKINIVNSNNVNAFVLDEHNIFITSKLLIELNDPEAIAGVIAHEIGHIKEKHLLRSKEIYRNQTKMIITNILLGAMALAAGSPELAIASLATGADLHERQMLKYSRQFEEAADHAAMKFLDDAYNSSIGLKKTFEYFRVSEKLNKDRIDPYLLTHPLSSSRLRSIKEHLALHKNISNMNASVFAKFRRSIVKLKAFLNDPYLSLKSYKNNDLNSLYARSIANYKIGNNKEAISLLNNMIKSEPANGYLYELIGQINNEYGEFNDAIKNYQIALNFYPKSSLIKLGLAGSYLNKNDPNSISQAIKLLEEVKLDEKNNDLVFRKLAIAYGKNNQIGEANYYLAEEALANNDKKQAEIFAYKSLENLKNNSKFYLRVRDIIETSILQTK